MTLPQMIRQSHGKWKDNTCMRVKRGGAYSDVKWSEYYSAVEHTAAALIELGVKVGDRVAILSHTRMEWAVADAGALTAGAITVPIYPNLGGEDIRDLLIRSGSKVLFLSDAEQVAKIAALKEQLSFLEKIVVFEAQANPGSHALPFTSLDEFTSRARVDQTLIAERLASRAENDTATIIFTSGTTGEPKGVMLTHDNILSNVAATLKYFDFGPGDLHLAHLPLAHIFERMGGYYLMLQCGAVIAYAESIQTVAANIAETRPTVVVTVPRIFEKIYAGIQTKAADSPAPVKALTLWAMDVASRAGVHLDRGTPMGVGLKISHFLADRIVFKKLRAKMGGKIRFFVSGGAPLAPELAYFFLGAGLPVMEGYGLTETSPVIAANTFENHKIGTVGRPLFNVQCQIAPDGEILVKGPSVFTGYYNNEEATREAFTPDGFFMTGDIGLIDEGGFLKITDRKKDLLVTAAGKNIAPQKVENVLKMDKFIAEAMLYGDKKNFLTAIIVPDFVWLEKYAAHKSIHFTDRASLVADPHIADLMNRRVEEVQASHGLSSYETVKKFLLLDHELSIAEGEVTPTLKLKRKAVTSHYRDQLEALYEK